MMKHQPVDALRRGWASSIYNSFFVGGTITDLNNNVASLESTQERLLGEIKVLDEAIKKLKTDVQGATDKAAFDKEKMTELLERAEAAEVKLKEREEQEAQVGADDVEQFKASEEYKSAMYDFSTLSYEQGFTDCKRKVEEKYTDLGFVIDDVFMSEDEDDGQDGNEQEGGGQGGDEEVTNTAPPVHEIDP
ncbi:uncharacterized protein LOC143863814 isoform X2 [Tasmannia lanceolata]|uniref:uncharacterized protein LOC143863814 isoform X2 n=1 Tax=Tasmannia lanceolata TaxID=3420 RepID=UPI0040630A8B